MGIGPLPLLGPLVGEVVGGVDGVGGPAVGAADGGVPLPKLLAKLSAFCADAVRSLCVLSNKASRPSAALSRT